VHHSVVNGSLFPDKHSGVHIVRRESGVRLGIIDLSSDDSQFEGTGFALRLGRGKGLGGNGNWSNNERFFILFDLNWLRLGEGSVLKLVGVAE
jgi:hypothetical protein